MSGFFVGRVLVGLVVFFFVMVFFINVFRFFCRRIGRIFVICNCGGIVGFFYKESSFFFNLGFGLEK